ncbi:coiled-coil domain-containing protein 85C [Contarinia nasturtii]|uniref:coiled-coil domain-containing protein 85C n=1 Tax=Contarinia nasturtii TaxID=265458 RepID=UPI0012D412DA|nr:coiled-coil domain-containing protein 85C [Contarinia nasturtii]
MSTSTSKSSAIPKIENVPSTSVSKQSIPQPISSQSKSNNHHQANPSQIPSHLSLHQNVQKSHGIPSIIPQPQKHLQPPRYQPPPPAPGGILKNISPQRSGIPTPQFHQSSHATETNAHLNLKFPQEVPKLTTVYIPDRNPGTSSRIATATATARSLQQQRQTINGLQSQPSPHLSTTDDEQSTSSRNHQQEMLKFVRKSDTDSVSAHSPNPNAIPSANNVIRMNTTEQSRHFQSLLAELRQLKDANQRLSDDNQELRDLCCFLDDDRQKGRKLAREWQRFGRYTASVMRQEVSAYQNKLRQLDDKQQELIRDNLELKELCLYLDEERANVSASIPSSCSNCGTAIRSTSTNSSNAMRDDGDGSSSSTNDEPMPSVRQFSVPEQQSRSALSDQTLQYVRSLERRLLEHELANGNNNVENSANLAASNANKNSTANGNGSSNNSKSATETINSNLDVLSGRPEAVVRALQILEVREQLERDRAGGNVSSMSPEHMDDGEKALLREMCNVVWRKLEENPNNQDV